MNVSNLEGYKRTIYIALIVIAFGVIFQTTIQENAGSLGTVFIALGGLLLIVGMNNKRIDDRRKKE